MGDSTLKMRIIDDPEIEFLVCLLPEQNRTENSDDGSGLRFQKGDK